MEKPKRVSQIFFACLVAGLALSGATYCDSAIPPPPPADTPLTVSVTGIGSGTVTSDVGGIDCTKTGGTCDTLLVAGTTVTLTATPDQGFFFNGWLGGLCQGIAACIFDLDQAESVQASFVNIAFYSSRNFDPDIDDPNSQNTSNIWLVNSDGSDPHVLAGLDVMDAASHLPVFSPDGNQIAFISRRNIDGTPTANPNFVRNVWIMNADGSNPQDLAGLDVTDTSANFENPRWSPDGSQILFSSRRNINGNPTPNVNINDNVWVVNADGSNPTALAGLDVAGVNSELAVWSPDGTQIAFISGRNIDLSPTVNPNGQENIFLMDADGGNLQALTQITVNSGEASWPQWSPDGTQLVFQSNRSLGPNQNGTPEMERNIWVMQADGSNQLALTEDTGGVFNREPQWSPDGSLIAFRSTQDPVNPNPSGPGINGSNIWAVTPNGSQAAFPLTALSTAGNFSDAPYWAPDASVVIFDSTRNLDPALETPTNTADNIWIVNPDGSGAFPVTDLMDVDNLSAFNSD